MTIVSLSVRYKSATVGEFIERHAADVSGRGIFVKTDRDFEIGTLLQLDVRIADKQTLIAGVGRVVWRRATIGEGTTDRPVGIGVQFLRVDKSSRIVIDQLLAARPDAGRRYEAEAEAAPALPDTASGPELPALPATVRAQTVAGARPRAAWHKATLTGVGSATPGAVSSTLPRPVPPPRRPSGALALPELPAAAAPPARRPKDSDAGFEREELTLIGGLPDMVEERKTTLVGVGGAPVIAPRLPPPVAPPRLKPPRQSPTPPPPAVASPPLASPPPPAATPSPMIPEADIDELEWDAAPDTVDDEVTRMHAMGDLYGDSYVPPSVDTARLPSDDTPLPIEPSSLPPIVETVPQLYQIAPPAHAVPPPAATAPLLIPAAPLPPPSPPAPRPGPLPLVLPPRELFVPPLPGSTAQGGVVSPAIASTDGDRKHRAASRRDKAIAAGGGVLLLCAGAAFLATHPWRSPETPEASAHVAAPSPPSSIVPVATTIPAPTTGSWTVSTPAPAASNAAPPAPTPEPVSAPTPPPATTQTLSIPTQAPVAANAPPRARPPTAAPATASPPPPPPPVATPSPPAPAPPAPAPTHAPKPSHPPVKSTVDDGF